MPARVGPSEHGSPDPSKDSGDIGCAANIEDGLGMEAGRTTEMIEELNEIAKEVIVEKEHHDPDWNRERKRKLKRAVGRLKATVIRQQVRRGEGCAGSRCLVLLPRAVRPCAEAAGGVARRCALAVTEFWFFDQFIMLCIVANCVFLALDDPADDEEPLFQQIAGTIFLFIFTAECLFKSTALGSKYLEDYWNWLDLVVVVEGWVSSFSPAGGGLGLSGLKTLRILRPLRVANRLPALKMIINALLASLPAIFDTFVVFFFFLVICSLICVTLWSGKFHYRCQDDSTGQWVDGGEALCYPAPSDLHPDDDDGDHDHDGDGSRAGSGGCAGLSFLDDPYTCERGETCAEYSSTPEGDHLNFDNVALGFLSLFAATTMEGWASTLYYTQAVSAPNTFAIFVAIIVVGNFTIVNLMIAAILVHLEKQQQLIAEDIVEREMEAGRAEEAEARKATFARANQGGASDNSRGSSKKGSSSSLSSLQRSVKDFDRALTRANISLVLLDSSSKSGDSDDDPSSRLVDRLEALVCAAGAKVVGLCPDGVPRVKTKGHWAYRVRWWALDDSSPFSFFIQTCIVFNLVVLAMDGHGISQATSDFLSTSNLVLTGVFVFEMALKLAVAGVPEYCSSAWNLFDSVIVTGSVIELAFETADGGGGGGGGGGGDDESGAGGLKALRVLRLLRVARLARLTNKSKVLNHAVTMVTGLIVKSSAAMFPVLLLLLLFMFVFAILGMQLFGGLGDFDDFIRFDNFYVSFVQCFFVITGEAWVDIMYATMNTPAGPWAALYFMFMVVVGTFVLLNLILAAVLSESLPSKSNVEQGLKKFNAVYDVYKSRTAWHRWKWATVQERVAFERRRALARWQQASLAHGDGGGGGGGGGARKLLLKLAKGLGVHDHLLRGLNFHLRHFEGTEPTTTTTTATAAMALANTVDLATRSGSTVRTTGVVAVRAGVSGGVKVEANEQRAGAERGATLAARERLGGGVGNPGDEKVVGKSRPVLPVEAAVGPSGRIKVEANGQLAGADWETMLAARERLRLGVGQPGDEVVGNSGPLSPPLSSSSSSSSLASELLSSVRGSVSSSSGVVVDGGAPFVTVSGSIEAKEESGGRREPPRDDKRATQQQQQQQQKLPQRRDSFLGGTAALLAATVIQKAARGFIVRKGNSYPTASRSSYTTNESDAYEDNLPYRYGGGKGPPLLSLLSPFHGLPSLAASAIFDDEEDSDSDDASSVDDEAYSFDAGTWTNISSVLTIVDQFAHELQFAADQNQRQYQQQQQQQQQEQQQQQQQQQEHPVVWLHSPEAHPNHLHHANSVSQVLRPSERGVGSILLVAQLPCHASIAGVIRDGIGADNSSGGSSEDVGVGGGDGERHFSPISSRTLSSRPPVGKCSLSVSFDDVSRPNWMAYRCWSLSVVTHPLFDDTIILAIVLSCVITGVNSGKHILAWDVVALVLAFVFCAELLLKCGACEYYAPPSNKKGGSGNSLQLIGSRRTDDGLVPPTTGLQAYLRDPWNRLDFAIVLSSAVLPAADSSSRLVVLSALCSVVRACRPLRVINHADSLRDTVALLYKSTLALSSIAVFLGFALVAYAVVGMQLLKGLYHYCDEGDFADDQDYLEAVGGSFPANTNRYGEPLMVLTPLGVDQGGGASMVAAADGRLSVRPCAGLFLDAGGVEREALGEWRNPTFHFDDFGSALLSVFVLSTEGWAEVVWQGLAATKVDYSAKPYANDNFFVIPYFAFAVCFFSLYLMNLFVGVVFDEYALAKAKTNKGHFDELVFIRKVMGEKLSRRDDQDWAEVKGRLDGEKPTALVARPVNKWRVKCAQLVESPQFHSCVLGVIALNAVALAITHRDQPDTMTTTLEWFNVGFALLFAVEAGLMIFGIGVAAYFANSVNTFDFVVTVVSLLDSLLFMTKTCTSTDSAFLRLVRSMRVFRLMRLVFVIKGCEDIYLACRFAFHRLVNVCILLLILVFFFANVGWVFFSDFSDAAGSRDANFQSIGGGMQLLFVLMTGDAWTDTFSAMVEEKPNRFGYVMVYFLFYLVVQYMVMVNLFVMVVCEAFEVLSEDSHKAVEKMLPQFKAAWALLDPDATGAIRPSQVEKFLRSLPPPFGVPYLTRQLYQRQQHQGLSVIDRASKEVRVSLEASMNKIVRMSSREVHEIIEVEMSAGEAKALNANFRRVNAKSQYVRSSCSDANKKREHLRDAQRSSEASVSTLSLDHIGRRHLSNPFSHTFSKGNKKYGVRMSKVVPEQDGDGSNSKQERDTRANIVATSSLRRISHSRSDEDHGRLKKTKDGHGKGKGNTKNDAGDDEASTCLFGDVLCGVVALCLSESGLMPIPHVSESMKELSASIAIADMLRRSVVRFRRKKKKAAAEAEEARLLLIAEEEEEKQHQQQHQQQQQKGQGGEDEGVYRSKKATLMATTTKRMSGLFTKPSDDPLHFGKKQGSERREQGALRTRRGSAVSSSDSPQQQPVSAAFGARGLLGESADDVGGSSSAEMKEPMSSAAELTAQLLFAAALSQTEEEAPSTPAPVYVPATSRDSVVAQQQQQQQQHSGVSSIFDATGNNASGGGGDAQPPRSRKIQPAQPTELGNVVHQGGKAVVALSPYLASATPPPRKLSLTAIPSKTATARGRNSINVFFDSGDSSDDARDDGASGGANRNTRGGGCTAALLQASSSPLEQAFQGSVSLIPLDSGSQLRIPQRAQGGRGSESAAATANEEAAAVAPVETQLRNTSPNSSDNEWEV